MAERDYFAIEDDAPATPKPIAPAVTQAVSRSEDTASASDDSFYIPSEKHHAPNTAIAVFVFLLLIGGCVFLVWHQMQAQNTKSAESKSSGTSSSTKP